MRLNVRLEDLSPVKKRLEIEVPSEQVLKEMDGACLRLSRQVKIKGFRKGRVPKKIVENLYADKIKGEVASKLIAESLPQAIKEKSLHPVTEPVIEPRDFKAGDPFSYTAVVEVRPEIDITGYTGMEIDDRPVDVSEEEVEERLNALSEENAYFADIGEDRGAREGDMVIVDFEGVMDGRAIKDGKADDYPVEIGSGNLLPSFESALIGMKVGEKREIEVEFPEDYRDKELAGKKGIFKVLVKGIKEKICPEINDEFARDLKANDLNELRERIKKELKGGKESVEEKNMRERILAELIDKNPFDIPPSLLESHIKELVKAEFERLYREGKKVEEVGKTVEELRGIYKKRAEKDIRSHFIINAIAEKEGVEVTDDDIEQRLRSIAERYGESYERIRQFYKERDMMGIIKTELLEDKVFDIIKKMAKKTN